MKLAILGTDSEILNLAAAARRQNHAIVWLGDVRPEDAAITQFAAGLIDRTSEWEMLLDRGIADAVLIGKGSASSDLRAERIKRLATEGVPLLVVYPVFDSVLPYYEVDMIRRESGAIVQHYNPVIRFPISLEVAKWLREGHPEIGQIHQLSSERRVAVAAREQVLDHFARDVELMAALAGNIRRVTAIGPTGSAASFASLQIQMSASIDASLRWSVGYSAGGTPGLQVTLQGESGNATLRMTQEAQADGPAWELETTKEGVRNNQPLEKYDAAHAAIIRLSDAVGALHVEQRAGASTWDSATRAMEVVDAAELSLQKGRTIEVFQQQLTERLAFRGTMAAIGCGLLLIAFVAVIVIAMLGGAEGIVRQRLAPSWSLVLLAVLAFFLLLQAIPLMAQMSSRNRRKRQATRPDGDEK